MHTALHSSHTDLQCDKGQILLNSQDEELYRHRQTNVELHSFIVGDEYGLKSPSAGDAPASFGERVW
jgi:hypothetical protein